MNKQVNLALPLGGILALVVIVVAGLTGSADEKIRRPTIKRLGTIDLLMVETTPVVFKDRLYRFEYVRDNYPANKTGASVGAFLGADDDADEQTHGRCLSRHESEQRAQTRGQL